MPDRLMRIGILTFHTTSNFGATLQCYALFRHLKSDGHEVEVVNYAPPGVRDYYRHDLFRNRGRSWRNIGRVLRFWFFNRSRLRLSGPAMRRPEELAGLAARYDLLLVGSDEVWKVEPPLRPLDASFYLDFADRERTRLVSYAASASTKTDLRAVAAVAGPLLRRFHALSVRDPNTGAMVAELLGGRAPLEVLDPTYLWDFLPETERPLVSGEYLALYGWLEREQWGPMREFASRLGLSVVSVGMRSKRADRSVMDVGPSEWMRVLRHARYIVTDFFHGAAFAIHFRVPFAVFSNPWKRVKLGHLLAQAGLSDREFPDMAAIAASPRAAEPPDFAEVERRIAPLRKRSISFLREQAEAARGRG